MNLLWQQLIRKYSVPEPNTGCWFWLKNIGKSGRGHLRINGKIINANRLSLAAFTDFSLDSRLQANHKITCSSPLCVNPDHLYAGTQKQNIRDQIKQGTFARGKLHGNGKKT